jgi:urease accessory protein
MSELTIIRSHPPSSPDHQHLGRARLLADRATLAKRRWRGVAEDGKEFGFDLDAALPHGSHFFTDEKKDYILEQIPEEVLEIPVTTPEQAARIAWNLGNLHFGVQVVPGAIRVVMDPAVRQFLDREDVAAKKVTCIFIPESAGSHHHG